MIGMMATVHMTYNEVSSNFAAVLENIRKGVEVIVEQDHRPVALMRPPKRAGRLYRSSVQAYEIYNPRNKHPKAYLATL